MPCLNQESLKPRGILEILAITAVYIATVRISQLFAVEPDNVKKEGLNEKRGQKKGQSKKQ